MVVISRKMGSQLDQRNAQIALHHAGTVMQIQTTANIAPVRRKALARIIIRHAMHGVLMALTGAHPSALPTRGLATLTTKIPITAISARACRMVHAKMFMVTCKHT